MLKKLVDGEALAGVPMDKHMGLARLRVAAVGPLLVLEGLLENAIGMAGIGAEKR